MLEMISLRTLTKIAGITGIIVASTGYAFRFKIQHDISKSEMYKDTIQYLHNHEKALELLGTPVTEGRVNISDHEALGTRDNIGWLTIPVKGSQKKGQLRAEMLIHPNSKESKMYNIYKVELKLNDIPDKVFVLKDDNISVQGAS